MSIDKKAVKNQIDGVCPTCGSKKLMWDRRDADHHPNGSVACTEANCSYKAGFNEYRTAYAAVRRASQ